jgi:hypothetical protein
MIEGDESISDGHVCVAGCWHVHYSRIDRTFCATIPLAILLPIYLRLEQARREKTSDRGHMLERKGRWNVGSRHGISASVSPLAEIGEMLDSMLGINHNTPHIDEDNAVLGGALNELSEYEDVVLNGLFDAGLGWDGME